MPWLAERLSFRDMAREPLLGAFKMGRHFDDLRLCPSYGAVRLSDKPSLHGIRRFGDGVVHRDHGRVVRGAGAACLVGHRVSPAAVGAKTITSLLPSSRVVVMFIIGRPSWWKTRSVPT